MTRRTRIFLIGSAGVLVLGLGTGVLASYMGIQNVILPGTIALDELDYIPQDTKVLAYANVREVMDSELRAKLMALNPDGRDDDPNSADRDAENDFFEATGLDPERDLDSVVASVTGGSDQARMLPIVVARGRFNDGLIENALIQHSDGRARVEKYRGIRMIVGSEPNSGESFAVAFAEPGVLVLGSETNVRRGLDAKSTGTNVTGNAEVMNLVRDSDDGNAWAVARFDALAGQAKLPEEITNHLPPITWFAVKGHINGGLRATLRAETRDDASAQNLREVIRGFVALARLQAGSREEFAALLNSLELGGTGKTVSLGFALDSAIVDALGHLVPRGRDGVAPPMPPLPPETPAPPVL